MHNAPVPAPPKAFPLETTRRIIRIQTLTLVWMTVEAVVSLGAAWMARSPAYLASAAIARSNFSRQQWCSAVSIPYLTGTTQSIERPKSQAACFLFSQICCPRFYFDTARARRGPAQSHRNRAADPCGSGHALACKQKRRLSAATASAALRADAAESAVCGYLALIALAGLVVNAIWRVSWADPVAALSCCR